MEGTVYRFEEFAVLYHLVCHPRTYVPCIMLGEGEWEADIKEGCIEAYKYSADDDDPFIVLTETKFSI